MHGTGWRIILALLALVSPTAGEDELGPVLAHLVDLPTAKERRAEADKLEKRRDVALEQWQAAMKDFGEFAPLAAGPLTETVVLIGEGKEEPTVLELYVPAGYDPGQPAPLMLMLHGSGGSGSGQYGWWKETADALGMLVLSPSEAGENEGYAFTARERENARAALRWGRRRANVDENRVFVSGISRGGHLAWNLALRHPDLFAGLFPFIGGPRLTLQDGQNNLRYVENVAHLVIRDLQGSQDDPALLFNLHLAFEFLEKLGAPHAELIEFPDLGHDYRFESVDWKALLAETSRRAVPDRVVLRAADPAHARAHWVEVTRLAKDVQETFTPRVDGTKWNALDAAGQKRYLQELVDERTARLEVRMDEPGHFTAAGTGVTGFRLLLTEAMLGPKRQVEVDFRGKTTKLRATPSARVLLREFAERFDRTFLPTAEVQVGK